MKCAYCRRDVLYRVDGRCAGCGAPLPSTAPSPAPVRIKQKRPPLDVILSGIEERSRRIADLVSRNNELLRKLEGK